MYSLNNQYPIETLPDRIRLSSGMTRTGGSYTTEEILDAGYKIVDSMPEVTNSQKVTWDYENGEWLVSDKTEDDIAHEKAVALEAIRQRRNALLAECDWTQSKDLPSRYDLLEKRMYYQKWAEYRTLLRDLPNTYAENPSEVVWPEQPSLS